MDTIERLMPPLNVDERSTLESWLDFHRARHNGHADLLRERIDGTTGV